MKPVAVILTIAFTFVALSVTVWLGRYQGVIDLPQLSGGPPTEAVPGSLEIPANGPFGKAVPVEMTYDFGVLSIGSKGSHVFVVKNEGQGPLRVKTGKTSCIQCTVGGVSREDDILPGESVDVTIKWEIKSPNEKFRQWAEVHTTDPDNKRIELSIEGRVDRPLRLTPEDVWVVGDLLPDVPTVVRGTLYSLILDEVTIDKFECVNPHVSVTWEPATPETLAELKAKSGVQITVSVAASSPLGPLRESITLVSPHNGGTSIQLGLTGQRSGPIEFKGPRWNPETNFLTLGEFPANKGIKSKLYLYVRDLEGELVVESIEQKYNAVKFTFPPTGKVIGKSKLYEVEVEIPPGSSAKRRGEDAEQIRLKLNHPNAKEYRFYVSYHSL